MIAETAEILHSPCRSRTVVPIPALQDNYIWRIGAGPAFVVVDPGQAQPVVDSLQASGGSLAAILVTHHHHDHVDGIPELVAHWRAFLEPGPIWDFRTRVVHGKLGTETISIHNGTVAEVSGWSEVHVGDPAQDLSWLFACSDTAFTDEVVRVYSSQMPQIPDQHLVERAEFYAEFALAQWLTHAVEYGDAQMIAHGEQMLQAVCENLRDSGEMLGQNQPLPERAEGLE